MTPLTIAEQGNFFVNFETTRSDCNSGLPLEIFDFDLGAPGRISSGQMFVEFQIPAVPRDDAVPIVFVHGGGHTGACWWSTPDGREGWATYFVRRGWPVYVVDQVTRGRSGYDATMVNRALRTGDTTSIPNIFQFALETAWHVFRFGPRPGEAFADVQFPVEHADHYLAQLVPDSNFGIPDPLVSVVALGSLLDRIGPSTLITHSQSGDFGFAVSALRPGLVRAIVEIEGASVLDDSLIETVFSRVPFLTVYGDHLEEFELSRVTSLAARSLVGALIAAGGNAAFVALPDRGMRGNSHMMMLDANSEEIASLIEHWLIDAV